MKHGFKSFELTIDKDLNLSEPGKDFLDYTGLSHIDNLDEVIPPQDIDQLKNALFAIDPGSGGLSCFRIRIGAGTLNWIAANVEKASDGSGLLRMELSDIQSLKKDSALAKIDNMTGLYNKHAIIDRAKELTQAYPRKNFYFFLMDIDHFKAVNDTFGHLRGDAVIIDVASIVKECVGDKGTVGRIGGDEFMILFEAIHTEPELREALREIRDTVKEKYLNMSDSISLTVSLGGALYPDYAQDYESLFKLADKMLYRAKVKGRDRYIIFTPSVHGNIDMDSKVDTVSHRAAEEKSKTRLILDLMSDYLLKSDPLGENRKARLQGGADEVMRGMPDDFTVREAIEMIMDAFDMDEAYIVNEDASDTVFGVRRDESKLLKEAGFKGEVLAMDDLKGLFDINDVALVNIFDIKKEEQPGLLAFMETERYRELFVYHMHACYQGGYLVFANGIDSACRLSGADIADLTFFARMVELRGF